MKKFLFIMLMGVLALPMMSQSKAEEAAYRAGFRSTTKVVAHKTFKRQHINVALRDEIPEGYASVTLAAGDLWQDGSGYQMLLDADATAYGVLFPETGPLTQGGDADASVYAQFEYKIPENADGSCNTNNIVMNNAVTILIPAGVYDYVITNPTPGDRIWISTNDGTAPGRADNYEFMSGATYIFTVTLGSNNDRVDLELIDPNAPVMPENVTVDPATGVVTWENDHDPFFNLRYREYNPNVGHQYVWDLETAEQFEGWMALDYDNDGYSWTAESNEYYAHSGSNYFESVSWIAGVGGLYPDNWLLSPVVDLGGTLSFWAYASWDDVIAVYVAEGDGMSIDNYVLIADNLIPDGWTQFTFDLSEFAGKTGRFAIRHYGCYDEYKLRIDDIVLDIPGDEAGEWIYAGTEGNEFALENLVPGTTYEVQVQAVGEDERTSNWTESTVFTYNPEVGPIEPTEKTDAPSSTKENYVYNDGNLYYNAYTVNLIETEPSTIYYRVGVLVDGDYVYGEWMEYTGELNFTEEGTYMIEAYAIAEGKTESDHIWDGFTVSKMVDVEELFAGKTVAGVRYFNLMGQEMQQANGVTIMVTTFTDGTTSAVKVVK